MIIVYDDYCCPKPGTEVTREFETAMAAMAHDDENPMLQLLGMPLKGDCEDCEKRDMMFPHGKSLICLACYAEREAFLDEATK